MEMAVRARAGHIAPSFSCIEILVSLYYTPILRVDSKNSELENRDRFILSKGQAAIDEANKAKRTGEKSVIIMNISGMTYFDFREKNSCCPVRIITVPSHLHQQLRYSEHLPLFQMIAKNVGIQRARGEFVLVTNIDVLFSRQLM